MATTYWASSSAKGAANGSSYADAIGTLGGGIALCTTKGDILNVIADGDHTWPVAETDIPGGTKGTTFADYGTLIRGVTDDDTDDPALASVVASGGDAVRYMFRVIANTGFVIVRNLEFDGTGKDADTNFFYTSRLQDTGAPDPGPVRFEGCSFLGGATGVGPDGARLILSIPSGPPAGSQILEVEDCYIQNWDLLTVIGAALDKSFVGCLIYNDVVAGGTTAFSQTLGAGPGGEFIFMNNTYYESIGNNVFSSPIAYQVGVGLGAGLVNVKDNLVFLESSHGSPAVKFFADGGDGSGTYTGTIDYNVLLGGPSVAVGDLDPEGWYQDLWDISPANDQYVYGQAEATVFVAPGSTYAWDALGNGVELTILKDLRPLEYSTASSIGGVVGALPAGSTDYTAAVTSTTSAPDPGQTVVITVTVSNSGTNATALVISAAVPAGLTYVSDVASQGTYVLGTGLWDVGALADSASANVSITCTVDSDQAGNTITFSASIDTSTPIPGTPTSDDSDTAVLDVVASDDTDPGSDAAAPVIDVLPLIAPTLSLELNVKLEMIQSRMREVYERDDFENIVWSEFTTKRLVLAPSTTVEVNLGGIARGEYLVLDATEAVDVSAVRGDTPLYWADVKALVIGRGDFEKIHVRNTSATLTSIILIGVTN